MALKLILEDTNNDTHFCTGVMRQVCLLQESRHRQEARELLSRGVIIHASKKRQLEYSLSVENCFLTDVSPKRKLTVRLPWSPMHEHHRPRHNS